MVQKEDTTEAAISAGLTDAARELRQGQTTAEQLLWHLLRDRQLLGFKFRRQHQFGDYIADFYCRKAGLVIECDWDVHELNQQWQHHRVRDGDMWVACAEIYK